MDAGAAVGTVVRFANEETEMAMNAVGAPGSATQQVQQAPQVRVQQADTAKDAAAGRANPLSPAQQAGQPRPVANLQGQRIGTMVNTTA